MSMNDRLKRQALAEKEKAAAKAAEIHQQNLVTTEKVLRQQLKELFKTIGIRKLPELSREVRAEIDVFDYVEYPYTMIYLRWSLEGHQYTAASRVNSTPGLGRITVATAANSSCIVWANASRDVGGNIGRALLEEAEYFEQHNPRE
ncbi:hypothetical protein [Streptomyces sp. RKAG293]|uniref:hypothetical protein n=1 Tax=Streptomyces sp. RKAG293 TaxID=2893403 RepID=UPI0020334C85|nr:hypothetical protein [Streptomyces sp. RKAG293]MCM2417659.1 hypothetical protein [Streptomyces sp. RKAG293]